ncbi:MAG: futalosine hydrolase [Solitalea-like symbiont of Acarus siro]
MGGIPRKGSINQFLFIKCRKILQTDCDFNLIINAGIAGSFDFNMPLGSVHQVVSDCFSDFGIEDKNLFIPIHKAPFFQDDIINDQGLITNDFILESLPRSSAITVNTVHGEKNSIDRVKKNYPYQLESMEGAAFLYVCKALNIKCLQLRAVSNYITERNTDSWKINLAIENLNKNLINIVDSISN